MTGSPLLEVSGLTVEMRGSGGAARVADDVSFRVGRGEIVGLVGESGCGKTLTALSLVRLGPPSARVARGRVSFGGVDLLALGNEEMAARRGSGLTYLPQEPGGALNPVLRIGTQLSAVIAAHGKTSRGVARSRAEAALARVDLPEPRALMQAYPHELSGGMTQRVAIALALAARPSLLLADEPTTALDATLQLEIVRLLRALVTRGDLGAILLITHDLGVVAALCDTVLVMYAGKIVESAPVRELFENPHHPYTQGLIGSHPTSTNLPEVPRPIVGRVPDLWSLPAGCAFHPRCRVAFETCSRSMPHLEEDGPSRRVACHAVTRPVPSETGRGSR